MVLKRLKYIIFLSFLFVDLLDTHSQTILPDTLFTDSNYYFVKDYIAEFDGDSPNWHKSIWSFDGNECEFNPSNILFNEGLLNLIISKKDSDNLGTYPEKTCWGAEYYNSDELGYGRYQVRMKPNSLPGIITSFFLYFAEWDAGFQTQFELNEIDIEFVGNTNKVNFTLHWLDAADNRHVHGEVVNLSFDAGEEYHIWEIEKTPYHISFFVDNEVIYSFDNSIEVSEQQHPQNISLNYWISNSTEWAGELDTNSLPSSTTYDFVAFYRLVETVNSIESSKIDNTIEVCITQDNALHIYLSKPSSIILELYTTDGRRIETFQHNENLTKKYIFIPKQQLTGVLIYRIIIGNRIESGVITKI